VRAGAEGKHAIARSILTFRLRVRIVIGGFLFAIFYSPCGRKLAVPIVAHGIQDTIDVLLILLGKYPGGL
jgi:hypothetical protein